MNVAKITSATLSRRIAENLAYHRNKLQLSQVDLARCSQIAAASISRFEGNARCPSILNLVRLSHALGVPLDELVK